MKLTEENADYMDCRPPSGALDSNLVPHHMRDSKAKTQSKPAARSVDSAPSTTNDTPTVECSQK